MLEGIFLFFSLEYGISWQGPVLGRRRHGLEPSGRGKILARKMCSWPHFSKVHHVFSLRRQTWVRKLGRRSLESESTQSVQSLDKDLKAFFAHSFGVS